MARPGREFERNVFINCPFDAEYYPLLRALLYVIVQFGFQPRIALERLDSGEQRVHKICELIRISKYSIHDLSRLKSTEGGELYRMNMPFELGVEYGCRYFASDHLQAKRSLILESSKYDYMKALSDLSGVDIKSHDNDPALMVLVVRNWFVETVGLRRVKSPSSLWNEFNHFTTDFFDRRREEGFSEEDLNRMPVPEYVDFLKSWKPVPAPASSSSTSSGP